ncbi:MAG: cytochrome P450 [Opitutales bacterium]
MSEVTAPPSEMVEELPLYLPGGSEESCNQAYREDPLNFQLEGYRQCGPIFRTYFRNRMWVVLAGPDANNFIWQKPELWNYAEPNAPFLEEMGPNHVTGLDGDPHKEKRAYLKPAFTMSSAMKHMPAFHQVFRNGIDEVCRSEQPVDIIPFWAELITWGNSRTVAQAEIPKDVTQRMTRWEVQMLRGLFLDDSKASYYEREEYRRLRKETFEWLGKIVDERLEAPTDIDDNYSEILKLRLDAEGDSVSRDHLINDLYFVLLAGTDNTAALINFAIMELYSTPRWIDWLREELDAWDGENVMELQSMSRLKAVIMETQRIRPGALQLFKYAIKPFEFGGYQVPANTDVLHLNNLGHFLEEFYPDPLTFNPERFIEKQRFVPKTFGFFGGGSHVCLGRNHTLMQTPLVLANLFKHWDLEFSEPINRHLEASYSGGRIEKAVMAHIRTRS